MEGAAGLPVGVQVLTRAFEDEKCVAALRALESARCGGPAAATADHKERSGAGAGGTL